MSEHRRDRSEVRGGPAAAEDPPRAEGEALLAAVAATKRGAALGAAVAAATLAAIVVMAQGAGAASWAAGAAAVALTAACVAWERRFGRTLAELARRKASAEAALAAEDLAPAEADAQGLDLSRLPTAAG